MKYFLMMSLALTSLLSFGMEATTFAPHLTKQSTTGKFHTRGVEPIGIIHHKPSHKPSVDAIKATSASSNNTAACTAQELAELADSAVVNYLISNETRCIDHLYGNGGAGLPVYSERRYELVAAAIVTASNNYNPLKEDIRRLTNYIRSYHYHAFYTPASFPVTELMRAAEHTAITAFFAKVSLSAYTDAAHYWNVSEVISYLDGTEQMWLYHDYLYRTLQQIDGLMLTGEHGYEYKWVVFSSIAGLSRTINNHRDTYEPYIVASAGLPAVLQYITTDAHFRTLDTDNATLAAGSLAQLLAYESMFDVTTAQLNIVLETVQRLDDMWFSIVSQVNYYAPQLCATFTLNLCDSAELRNEVMNKAFPHTYEYDGGKLLVHTPLSRDRVNQLVYQLNEVKSSFFNLTGQTAPVADDANEVAQLYVYDSPTNYRTFQPYLFNLAVNNGGIYIEPWGSMFTYDRQPWESSLTLDELVRHEYGHYLTARYLVPGFWGQTDMYAHERLTWFDEGIANVVAGGMQYQGIQVLQSVIYPLTSMTELPTTRDTVNATYSSSMIYPFGSIILNYLIDTQSALLAKLFTALRNDSVDEFEDIREQISQLNSTAFHDYINTQADIVDTVLVPWSDTLYPDARFLQHTTAQDIELDYISILGGGVSCADVSAYEFACNLDIQVEAPLQFDRKTQVDAITKKLVSSNTSFNVATSNCYATEDNVRCLGALRPGDVQFVQLPDFVVPNALYDGENGSTFHGKLMSSFDEFGMPVKFSGVDWPQEGIVHIAENGDFEFIFDPNHSVAELSFTYKATSGLGLTSNIGTVIFKLAVIQKPTAANISIDVIKGSKAVGTLKGNGYGAGITYEVLNASNIQNGTFSYDTTSGAFEFTPTAAFVGTVKVNYVVKNLHGDTSDTATLTITVKDTAPPPNNTAAPKSSGGSIDPFMALLLFLTVMLLRLRQSKIRN